MSEHTLHPVAALLLDRRRHQSKPGNREDPHRVALAVEGGGMRGIVSGAMLAALADCGLTQAFDSIYALSAGAINGTYFAAGGGWQALSVYYDDLVRPDFIDYKRVARNRPVLSLDYVLDVVMEQRNPLDYKSALTTAIKLNIVVSEIESLRPVVLTQFESKDDLKWALRASASLPLVAGPPTTRNGLSYYDGGVLMSHPVEAALIDEPTHVVVVRTRTTARPRPTTILQRIVATRLNRQRRGLGDRFLEQQKRYSVTQAVTSTASSSRSGPPFILDVSCPPGSHAVSRLTQERGTLYEGMRAGYKAMLLAVLGVEYDIHLRPATREDLSQDRFSLAQHTGD